MTNEIEQIASKVLGKTTDGKTMMRYETPDDVDASLLVGIPRVLNRTDYDIAEDDFCGMDTWNAYEFSCLLNNGFPISGWLRWSYPSNSECIVESKSAKLYLNSYNMAKMGASIMEAIDNCEKQIEKAREIWKSGFVAESIHNFCKNNHFIDTSDRKHKGLLDGNDLANWQAHEEKPRSFKYKNYEVFKTDVWGQGPSFLQQLAILDHFDLSKFNEDTSEFVHIVTEATKLAFADREAFYGDPNFVNVPIDSVFPVIEPSS